MRYICVGLMAIFLVAGQAASAQISERQIYEEPDNHDLNLEYAKQQIIKGEMLDAGSALERMLYANPNWHSARLLYAAVLYRLDDQQAAMRELSLLDGKDLNIQQKEKLESYKTAFLIPPASIVARVSARVTADIDDGSSFSSQDYVQGQFSVQIRDDDNAGNALTDQSFGFRNQGDVSVVVKGRVRAFAPVTGDWTVRAEVSGQTRRHDTFSDVDYDVMDGSIGLTLNKSDSVAAIDLDARQINIAGETYVKQIGPRITLSRKVGEKTYTNFSLSAYNQDYNNLDNALREEKRDGMRVSYQAGILHKINARNKIRVAVGYEDKSAELSAFSYQGPVLAVAYGHKFDGGYYFKAQGKTRRLNYDGSLTDSENTKETRLTGRIAVGRYLDVEKHSLKSAALEIGYNLTRRDTNIQSNEFENLGVDIRLSVGF